MRTAITQRHTTETRIDLTLSLDGTGRCTSNTGIGFLDHMLELFTRHGKLDLQLTCQGDLQVDAHHTVEDCGIALGMAIAQALGDKRGICRYGQCLLPMDEALLLVALDISGRPLLVYDAQLLPARLGAYETETTEEFFRAVAGHAGLTLHIKALYGKNAHHIIEGLFKAFGRALRQAVEYDPRESGIPSTKGTL